MCYESQVIGDPDKTFIGDALWLRQVLINILGNAVKFTDAPGTVSFTVELPLQRAQHMETSAAQDQAESDVELAGLHVLIAEDQEMNADILTELLEMEDISSAWAENGQRAVEMFAQSEAGRFDAILMDMRMPVMDGLTATREIRKLDRPDAATVPIIALTANAFEEDVKQCLQAGMDAHLSKPVDIERLKTLLGKMLAAR